MLTHHNYSFVFSFLKIFGRKCRKLRNQRLVLMEIGEERSLEETATWAVSVFCFFLLLISLIIEGSLHKLSEVLFRIPIENAFKKELLIINSLNTVPIYKEK